MNAVWVFLTEGRGVVSLPSTLRADRRQTGSYPTSRRISPLKSARLETKPWILTLGNNPDRSASQLRGGHYYVVARINHWRVRNTETRGPHLRPQFSLFLKEALGGVQLRSL